MYPWYDAWWLADYARARAILARERPDMLALFERSLNVLEAPADFVVPRLDGVFDEPTLETIRHTLASLGLEQLETHEAKQFGRFVVHNHPYFTELQNALVPLVSRHAGEPVEPSYNFASLYGSPGVCPPHMDAPDAKWTLDVCVNQSAPWPIHFSQIVPWPAPGDWPEAEDAFEEAVRTSSALRFSPVTLEPGQAALFSGSSQWHYRDRMPSHEGRRFCELLFFHFIPAGTRDLVRPSNWARIFGVPHLAGLGGNADHFI